MRAKTPEEREAARKAMFKRYEQQAAERQAHKMQLAIEHGLSNHPKLDLLYEKAWEYGHANGFNEVAFHFEELKELIE